MRLLVITAVILVCSEAAIIQPTNEVIHVTQVKHGISGSGVTTRYWDCCKPSCAWNGGGAQIRTPVSSCHADGASRADTNEASGCDAGGTAFMCSNQEAIVVNDTLAYGYAAASFSGGVDQSYCCRCFRLTFMDPQIANKQMIVQITNTGADLGANHFDIAIPGGGNGIFGQGCTNQWGGQTFNSVNSEQDCYRLPQSLQSGCAFRFQWMKGSSNPPVNFDQVDCPGQLVGISGCQ